jgi:type I restriction enzyme S subunit
MTSWRTAKLGSIARVRRGASPRPKGDPKYFGGEIPWLKIGDVSPGDRYVQSTEEGVTEAGRERSVYIEPGTLLLSNSASVGRPVVTKIGVCIHDGWLAIDELDPAVTRDYLYWFFTASRKQLQTLAPSGTQKNLNTTLVKALTVPLPPLPEQQLIVKILDRADTLRKRRDEAVRRSDQILPALFINMFGDPTLNPMKWPVCNLAELATELRYGTSAKCVETPDGLPVLRIPNVVRGEIDLSDLKYCELSDDEVELARLEQGDLLIVRTNGNRNYVGRCAVFTEERPCLFASYLIRVRLDRDTVDPWYVAEFLRSMAGRYAMSPAIRTTAGQSNINTQGLRQVSLPVPPLARQEVFRDRGVDLRGLLKRQREASERVEAVFSSLLTRAFSGELTAKWREAHVGKLLTEIGSQQSEPGNRPAVRKGV